MKYNYWRLSVVVIASEILFPEWKRVCVILLIFV